MKAEVDPLSSKMLPFFHGFVVLGLLGALLVYGSGMLNLFLGRERVVEARLVGWEVQVGRRANVVVHSFQGGGHTYVWRFSRVAPVEQTRPVELVIDGLLWDEIVQLRQDGQVAWRRI